ncbi:MAG: hypothetical protein AB8I08_39455 [Sandaracinaceae bacterium]
MRHYLVVTTLGLLLAACGPATPNVAELDLEPYNEEHAAVFENGVDMVADPQALGGSWLRTWEEELDQRISMADLVALVTVRAMRHDTDLERRDTLRLVAHPDRVFLGQETITEGQDILFSVREGEGGYGTVENNERRLLDSQFFAFVKWERDSADQLIPHWHLSPATDDVALRVRDVLAERRQIARDNQGTRRVIVHRE